MLASGCGGFLRAALCSSLSPSRHLRKSCSAQGAIVTVIASTSRSPMFSHTKNNSIYLELTIRSNVGIFISISKIIQILFKLYLVKPYYVEYFQASSGEVRRRLALQIPQRLAQAWRDLICAESRLSRLYDVISQKFKCSASPAAPAHF